MIKRLIWRLEGRSKHWPKVRRLHLDRQSYCAACDALDGLEVHHITPFNEAPERELDPNNLVTLCKYCHLTIAHLRDFKLFNRNINSDIVDFRTKRAVAKLLKG